MKIDNAHFELRLARTPDDIRAAQRLRYAVFVSELGGDGPMIDHDAQIEADCYDPFCDHLILLDHSRAQGNQVVGVYRVMRRDQAARAGQFYSEGEYDLTPLRQSGRRLLELGRSCVHRDYRGGAAMMHLWSGLAGYIADHDIDLLFGVASFHGTDPQAIAGPLSLLHHRHLAPSGLRPRARPPGRQAMDLIAPPDLDRPAAIRAIPALIKAYLRLGGCVAADAFIDRAFNCIDVCLVLDVTQMPEGAGALYRRNAAPQMDAAR